MIECAIGIVHIILDFIEHNTVPTEIKAPQTIKPAVFFLMSEKNKSINPMISRYMNKNV